MPKTVNDGYVECGRNAAITQTKIRFSIVAKPARNQLNSRSALLQIGSHPHIPIFRKNDGLVLVQNPQMRT
jgi:hypothetical protein